jgi:hypothetical protein
MDIGKEPAPEADLLKTSSLLRPPNGDLEEAGSIPIVDRARPGVSVQKYHSAMTRSSRLVDYVSVLLAVLLLAIPTASPVWADEADGPDSAREAPAKLSGTYTIGDGADYSDFGAAVSDLKSQGVSGAVTFEVEDGTYSEHVKIPEIEGASSSNTIRFKAKDANLLDEVTIEASGAKGSEPLRLNGADHLRFERITLDATGSKNKVRAGYLKGTVENVKFKEVQFLSHDGSNGFKQAGLLAESGTVTKNLVVDGCVFDRSASGVFLKGSSSGTSSGAEIKNSVFGTTQAGELSRHGIQLGEQYKDPTITDNDIASASGNTNFEFGIKLQNTSGTSEILKNDLKVGGEGIVVEIVDGSGLIANNEITALNLDKEAGLELDRATDYKVYHNSVNVTGRGSGRDDVAFQTENEVGGSVIKNNIFVAETGPALHVENESDSDVTVNHNNLYTKGPVPVTYDGTDYGLVSRYQQGTSQGTGSVSAPPVYTSTTDLTPKSPFLDDEGMELSKIGTDIDGVSRSSSPSLGAHEFTAPKGKLTKDTYTVGGSSPDYATVFEAMEALKKRGVDADGTVTFKIRDGTYGTGEDGSGNPLSLPHIGGTDLPTGENPVVFTSASEDRNKVFIRASGAAGSEPLRLVGADYLSFEHLTFQATGRSGTVRAVSLKSRLDAVSFSDAQFLSDTGDNIGKQVGLYAGPNSDTRSLSVIGCAFGGGASGLYHVGSSRQTQISSNSFGTGGTEQTRHGIYLENEKDGNGRLTIFGNGIFSEPGNDGYRAGIWLKNIEEFAKVAANNVEVSGDGIALRIASGSGLIVNNQITVLTTEGQTGLLLDRATNQEVYHNSVNITGKGSDLPENHALFSKGRNDGSVFKNNLFVAERSAAMRVKEGANLTFSHNGLYTKGPVLVRYSGTDYGQIDDYQEETTSPDQGTGSVFAPPAFASDTDLTPSSPFVDDEGEDLTDIVSTDGNFDDLSRTVPVSLGAIEVEPSTTPSKLKGGTYTVGGKDPDYSNLYEAIEALKTRGVAIDVTFDIRSGTYGKGANGGNALVIPPIAGTSAPPGSGGEIIFFQSATGDPTDVVVKASGAPGSEPLRLFGADNVYFRQLTFRATRSKDEKARAVYLKSRLSGLHFTDVRFQSYAGETDPWQVGLFGESGSITDRFLVKGCSFGASASGVYLKGNSKVPSEASITGNKFGSGSLEEPTRRGIQLNNYGRGAAITFNKIVSEPDEDAYSDGIKLRNSDGAAPTIAENDLEVSGTGIVVELSDAPSSGDRSNISNNEVTVLTRNDQAGLELDRAKNQNIYHNSVNITAKGSDPENHAFRSEGGNGGSVIKNNLFVAEASKAMKVENGGALTLDHNGLYTGGSVLVRYSGTDYSDLASYQNNTSQGSGSVSADPNFASKTDLTPGNTAVDEEGADLINVVPYDIDLDPRSAPPTLGAQEINVGLTVAGGGANNLDFDPSISAGTDNNPVGLFQLTAGKSGATLTTVSVTNGSPGVSGIKQARLYRSSDQTFSASGDTELATFNVDETSAEKTFVFDGFSQSVPTSGGYLFLTVDVKSTAPGSNIQFRIKDESDLEVPNGGIATVNGQTAASLAALPLNTATAAPVKTMSKNVSGDGTEDFGETGTDIQFSGVSSPGEVTVNRYDEKPSNPQGISESTVSSYRLTIDEGSRFDFSSAEIAFAVSELRGISDPSKVTVYKRDTEGAGSFNALTTTVEDNGTPDDVTDDTLYATSNSFSEFVFASDSEALPVEMARFDARLDDEQVRLTWATASETGNAGFEVQREKESAGWATVGRVEGAGTTTRPQRYRFVDENLPYDADSLTYRLRQVDTDGSANFSETVTVARDVQAIELKGTYPNPARRQATVRYALPAPESSAGQQQVTIRLYDVLGRRVRTLVDAEQEGRQKTALNVSDLSSGVYFLRLRADGTIKTRKLTVVR